MQRWIAVGVLSVMLIVGCAGFAYWTHRQNRPSPMWVELPINPETTDEQRDKAMANLGAKLREKERLLKVAKDMGLAEKWKLASDAEAEAELSKRVFVKLGETAAPMGRVPALHIGVEGSLKESKLSGEIAVRLMEDVKSLLGIQKPTAR